MQKFNRTRDIRNYRAQGWADTTFCTRKWSETYILLNAESFKTKIVAKIEASPHVPAVMLW